jgi:hypothetical protein
MKSNKILNESDRDKYSKPEWTLEKLLQRMKELENKPEYKKDGRLTSHAKRELDLITSTLAGLRYRKGEKIKSSEEKEKDLDKKMFSAIDKARKKFR